jgi:hypothetical protein
MKLCFYRILVPYDFLYFPWILFGTNDNEDIVLSNSSKVSRFQESSWWDRTDRSTISFPGTVYLSSVTTFLGSEESISRDADLDLLTYFEQSHEELPETLLTGNRRLCLGSLFSITGLSICISLCLRLLLFWGWGPSALQPWRLIVLEPPPPSGVPSFISRGAAHQAAWETSAGEGRN